MGTFRQLTANKYGDTIVNDEQSQIIKEFATLVAEHLTEQGLLPEEALHKVAQVIADDTSIFITAYTEQMKQSKVLNVRSTL